MHIVSTRKLIAGGHAYSAYSALGESGEMLVSYFVFMREACPANHGKLLFWGRFFGFAFLAPPFFSASERLLID